MINQEQDQLDRMLQYHFAGKLDHQLGKSRKAFWRRAAGAAGRQALVRRLVAVAAALALAAGAALIAQGVLQARHRPMQSSIATQPEPVAPVPQDVRRVVIDQVSDEGVIGLGEGAVAHRYRRQIIEQTQWYDPETHVLRQDIQRQGQIVLVGSQTY